MLRLIVIPEYLGISKVAVGAGLCARPKDVAGGHRDPPMRNLVLVFFPIE